MHERDHLAVHEETIHLVKSLRSLLTPQEEGGHGLSISEVAKALGMAPAGHGVRTWTGTWNPRAKRFVGGRNLPTGARREALAKFVRRTMARWMTEAKPRSARPLAAAK